MRTKWLVDIPWLTPELTIGHDNIAIPLTEILLRYSTTPFFAGAEEYLWEYIENYLSALEFSQLDDNYIQNQLEYYCYKFDETLEQDCSDCRRDDTESIEFYVERFTHRQPFVRALVYAKRYDYQKRCEERYMYEHVGLVHQPFKFYANL